MSLNLYRRHSSNCPGGRALHSMSYETDELRRSWKKCSCPIYTSGTLARRFRRKNTDKWNWDEAKAVAAAWEAAGAWGGEICVNPALPPAPAMPHAPESITIAESITIKDAVAAFLAEHARSSSANTNKKYRIITNKLLSFSTRKGYVMIDQWGPSDVREFRQSWGVSAATSVKNLSVVKAFFEFALSNEWIHRNPARLVKNPRGRAGDDPQAKERAPFSDEELKRMFEACETRYGRLPIRWSRTIHDQPADSGETANYNYLWTGQDLADFISISVYTGLRISDVSTFHISRLKDGGECHIRTTKNGRKVYTWIPEWLQVRVRERATKFGPFIFGEHTTKDLNVITDVWRRKLNRLWAMCGPWAEKPTPHRFRHTFARILLERPNVTVRDVAELLGDTENMVRRHYAAWVIERQERLTNVLKEAFSGKPTPELVVVQRKQ